MSDHGLGPRYSETVSILDQAVADAHGAYAAARPRSAAQAEAAARVLPAGSTRSVLDFDPFPFRVAKAEGSLLHDVDGFTYVDLLGDYTAGLFGHNPPEIASAVQAVLDRGWSLGAIGDNEHRLAELLCARFPSIEQIRFTNSGTEANLMAVSLARHGTGRTKVLVFDGAYHGGLLYFGPHGAPLRAPYEYVVCTYNDLGSVASAFDTEGSDIACVLIEPMMGAGGGIRGDLEFLTGLRRLCDANDTLLIFDEVMTSRMSIGGAQLRLGITPDLTTLGKYLGGGMTFGAFGGSADLMGAFDPARRGSLTHGGTFNNNALTMGVGAVAVADLVTESALDRLYERGEALRNRLSERGSRYGLQATGWGSILGIHATDREISTPADLGSVDQRIGELLFHGLLTRGFYTARRGFIALSLAVTDEQLDGFLAAFDGVVHELSERSILRESLTNLPP
ncbi:MAG: aminotransferase class III-fold pyridoxal phosphate-dependent enzyme [Acidimicrobiia bacterium]|nr:aminotransferase class III-fold pyridoxal phosphate-dependent enzyme [Acidimicrobiia bacterium]